jgi:hypothetical protein
MKRDGKDAAQAKLDALLQAAVDALELLDSAPLATPAYYATLTLRDAVAEAKAGEAPAGSGGCGGAVTA